MVTGEGEKEGERGAEEGEAWCWLVCQLAPVVECAVEEGEVKEERVEGGGEGGELADGGLR